MRWKGVLSWEACRTEVALELSTQCLWVVRETVREQEVQWHWGEEAPGMSRVGCREGSGR